MKAVVDVARQFGRSQRNARLYLLNNALSGVTTGIVLVLYNLYLVSLGYSTAFVGQILFIGTVGGGIAIFPAGYVIDRVRAKPILIVSNFLIGLIGIGQILFRQPIPLLVSSFFAGIALVFTVVINAPFLTRNSDPGERSALFSMNISIGLITLVIGEVLGGALPLWFQAQSWLMAPLPGWAGVLLANQPGPRSYQLALLFAGLIAAPSFVPLFLLREAGRPSVAGSAAERPAVEQPVAEQPEAGHPIPELSPTGHPTTTGHLTTEHPQGASLHVDNAPPAPARDVRRDLVVLAKLVRTPFFVLLLVYAFTGSGAGLVVPYFNIFFVQHLRASSALFGLIDGGANAATALLTLAAPWLAAHFGRLRSVEVTRLFSIPLLLTIGLSGVLPLAALLYPLRQGIMDMSNGVLQVYSMEVVEERYRGLANSAYQVAYQVPWALTVSLGGLLIARLGYTPLFLATALCYLIAIGVLWSRSKASSKMEMKSARDK